MLGPLAIRVNQWQNNGKGYEFHSPYQRDFVWKDRVVWAECGMHSCPPLGLTDPFFADNPEVLDIQESCWCGIYATTYINVAKGYLRDYNSACFVLVEGLGVVWIHETGFRASGVQIVKVIGPDSNNLWIRTHDGELTAYATARFYGVDIINWRDAKKMIDYQFDLYINLKEEQENDGA